MGPKIKLHIKTSPAFPPCLNAYSYRLFKKFNRATLNYSLEALCHFPGGGYTHTALETVQNELTVNKCSRQSQFYGVWSSFTRDLH